MDKSGKIAAMEEIAEVIEVLDKEIKISLRRTAACDGCASVNLCRPGGKQYLMITKPTDLKVGRGDIIKVAISDRAFLGTILLVYGLPTLDFLIFVGVVEAVTKNPLFALLAGLAALIISLAFVVFIDRLVKRKNGPFVTVIGIVNKKF